MVEPDCSCSSSGLLDPCTCQPLLIPNSEYVARALFYSFHVESNGKLKWKAFQPDRGESDLSVMRIGCLTATECKARAKAMQRQGEFRGFALLMAGAVRAERFDVRDSRHIFCGHADLLLGMQRPVADGDPADVLETAKLRALAQKLIKLSTTRLDLYPAEDTWREENLWVPNADVARV